MGNNKLIEKKKEALGIWWNDENPKEKPITKYDISLISKDFESVFEIDNQYREKYLVLHDEKEVNWEMKAQFETLWDDMGLSFFNKNFQDFVIYHYVDEAFFEKEVYDYYFDFFMEDSETGDVDDVDAEVESYLKGVSDYIEEFEEIFGKDELVEIINSNYDFLDIEGILSDLIRLDGAGHFLASYDGVEHEIKYNGDWFYIYRIN